MDVPISGIILAPFSLAFFVFAPSRLSELAVFITIFQAASIINLGSFGLTPYFFVVMLIALRLVPKW